MKRKPPKPRPCRNCGQEFQPAYGLGKSKACSPKCAMALVAQENERKQRRAQERAAKEARAKTRAEKKRLKPTNELRDAAREAFNAYIRYRDRHLPCISCGLFEAEPIAGCMWDCGHYLSVGANPELQFDEQNAHRQHSRCNRGAAIHALNDKTTSQAYREFLVLKIGEEAVARLEGPQEPKQYRADDYIEIEAKYKAKLKELKNNAPERIRA